jgi:hypothetical protein
MFFDPRPSFSDPRRPFQISTNPSGAIDTIRDASACDLLPTKSETRALARLQDQPSPVFVVCKPVLAFLVGISEDEESVAHCIREFGHQNPFPKRKAFIGEQGEGDDLNIISYTRELPACILQAVEDAKKAQASRTSPVRVLQERNSLPTQMMVTVALRMEGGSELHLHERESWKALRTDWQTRGIVLRLFVMMSEQATRPRRTELVF